ncbi:MAG: NAD-dependent epimerase/dehydratase family protein, partial [Chloroflexia bacterium]|nr:NAD-dependent epimerase/dehydratase family protein [Chloroflexia bacterium]
MSIVVTGATGHVGNNLVRALLERKERVRALVYPGDRTRSIEGLSLERIPGDVCDPDSLRAAFAGADTVYHVAGIVSIIPGREDLLERVNVGGTRNVVQACLHCGVRRLVYVASIHALVEPPHGTVIDERMPFDPRRIATEYGRSKARASLEVLRGVEQGLDAVIACPSGIVGPHDFMPSVVGKLLIDAAQRRLPAYVRGGYDFVDVRD